MIRTCCCWLLCFLLPLSGALADEGKTAPKPAEKEKSRSAEDEAPVVTHHEVRVDGKVLKYTATAGLMPLRDADGKTEAHIFYVAYTRDDAGDPARRPLMFSFNGGPGSASVWLHLGALGPKRVALPEEAVIPAPPYRLIDNEYSWLDATDLVFIDPVETGFSRAVKPELNKKFHGLQGDIASVGEFIRMYLTRSERWGSPLFLVGESYGTTRAAGLAGHLADKGIAFNGVILVSTVLDFQTIEFGRTNDTPFVVFLPAYTATAWYHKKLPAELQEAGLHKAVEEARRWAEADYRAALAKGDGLAGDERAAAVKAMARLTGLSERFIELNDLRVTESAFAKELLRDRRRSVGRFDSRYLGVVTFPGASVAEFDPSLAAVRPAYTATFNHYVRAALGYKTDTPYNVLGSERMGRWDWGLDGGGYPQTSSYLRAAMNKNPHMKILFAAGYYDLATPLAAVDWTLAHMSLDPSVRKNVRVEKYEAGHMMYVHAPSLAKLKRDAARFIEEAVDR